MSPWLSTTRRSSRLWRLRSRRSSGSSARARSCAWAPQEAVNVNVIPTGSIGLDAALGVGGIPRGRVIEIYGPESSGKTTLALHVIAQAQKTGGLAAFIDAEHALDPEYCGKLGVDIDNLLVAQPDNGEQALEIAETLIRSGSVDVIVVDSVAALVPRAELEGEMGDASMGLQARLMSQALRKLTGIVSKSKTCVIFINQIREKIGVMFGNPETTTGGRALKFYASVRLDIRRIGAIKSGEDVDRQPHQGQGGQEQGGGAVPRRRVRHPVRRGHLQAPASCSTSASSTGWSPSPGRGSRTARPGSARGARTRGRSSRSTRRSTDRARGEAARRCCRPWPAPPRPPKKS